MSCINQCVIDRLKQIRSNLLDQIVRMSETPIGNNYSYSIEGQSVVNGADTNAQNMASLLKQLQEVENTLSIYCPFEIHTVIGEP